MTAPQEKAIREALPVQWTERQTMAAINATGMHGAVTLTYEHGPYDISRPSFKCDRLAEHIVALRDAQWLAQLAELRAEVERLRADADHHRQLFNVSKLGHEQAFAQCQRLSALLRRSLSQLGKWQRKYGEHDPAWLPPDGDVRLAEDIDAALDASRLALKEAL